MDQSFLILVFGALLILAASVVEAYSSFGRQARDDVKPGILKGWFKWVMEAFWVIASIAGGIMLLLIHWSFAIMGVVAFWLLLPFMITPIVRSRLLPHWEEVKSELAGKKFDEGVPYDERNYLRGDWWMTETKKPRKKPKKAT